MPRTQARPPAAGVDPRFVLTAAATLVLLAVAPVAAAAPPHPDGSPWLAGMLLDAKDGRVFIARVLPGSPAARSGLAAGDVILVIGDHAVVDLDPPSPRHVLRMAGEIRGDTVRLVVGRGAGTFGVALPVRGPASAPQAAPAPLETGAAAPAFEARALDGAPVSLAALRGRPVLIDFWASWCPPCRDAALVLRRLADQYGDRLAIVGVSLDDDRAAFEAFVFNRHMPGRQIHDGGPRGPIGTLYGAAASGLPYAVLVSADGKVVAMDRSPAALEAAIERLTAPAAGAAR